MKTLETRATKYRSQLGKFVDTDDVAKSMMLDILCHQLALYEQCRDELNKAGSTFVETKTSIRQHPSVNAARNSADMVSRYMDKLGLSHMEAEEVDEIQATIKGKVA